MTSVDLCVLDEAVFGHEALEVFVGEEVVVSTGDLIGPLMPRCGRNNEVRRYAPVDQQLADGVLAGA